MPKLHDKVDVLPKPGWLKIRLHRTADYADVRRIVEKHELHTICSSGRCPNQAECWSRRTATFMILGGREPLFLKSTSLPLFSCPFRILAEYVLL